MNLTEGEYEPFLSAYAGDYDPMISYAVGNRDIGLLFGQRARVSMLWKMHGYKLDDIVLVDEAETEHLITNMSGVTKLSFIFDYLSFPILAVELPEGIKVYKFTSYGGDEAYRTLIAEIPGARNPKLIPSNVSDLGSVFNQPSLIYIDDVGNVVMRSYKDNFKEVADTILYNLKPTDELREVGITQTGKIQIELSKIKETS